MTSAVTDICNRALSEIGTQSQIASLTETSAEATQCKLWYDKLRQQLLRTANWGFARKQVNGNLLGDLVDNTSPYPFLYKYAYPSDCLKVRYILGPPIQGNVTVPTGVPVYAQWLQPTRANRFIINSDIDPNTGATIKTIITNVQFAIIVYTADITDPSLFDVLFDGALSSALAYRLVIPLSGNVGERAEFKQAAVDAITQARVADGNEAVASSDHLPDWIATRFVGGGPFSGCAGPYGGFPGGGFGYGWGNWLGGYDSMGWGS